MPCCQPLLQRWASAFAVRPASLAFSFCPETLSTCGIQLDRSSHCITTPGQRLQLLHASTRLSCGRCVRRPLQATRRSRRCRLQPSLPARCFWWASRMRWRTPALSYLWCSMQQQRSTPPQQRRAPRHFRLTRSFALPAPVRCTPCRSLGAAIASCSYTRWTFAGGWRSPPPAGQFCRGGNVGQSLQPPGAVRHA